MAAIDQNSFTHRIQRLFGGATKPAEVLRPKYHSSFLVAFTVIPLLFMFTFNSEVEAGLASFDLPVGTSAEPAQEVSISGTVTDGVSGEPLIGATVTIPGTEIGTITDFTGEYTLVTPAEDIELSFSYVGYMTVNVPIDASVVAELNTTMFKEKEGDQSVVVDVNKSLNKADKTKVVAEKPASLLRLLNKNILVLVDGKLLSDEELDNLAPEDITGINVIKDAEKIKELGHGTLFKKAILIITKE